MLGSHYWRGVLQGGSARCRECFDTWVLVMLQGAVLLQSAGPRSRVLLELSMAVCALEPGCWCCPQTSFAIWGL